MKLEEILKTALVISKCTIFKQDKFGNKTVELESTGKVQRLTDIYEKKQNDYIVGDVYDDRLLIANISLSPDADRQSSTLPPLKEFLKSQRSTPPILLPKSVKIPSKERTLAIENGVGVGGVDVVTSTVQQRTVTGNTSLEIPILEGSSGDGSSSSLATFAKVPIIEMSTQTPPPPPSLQATTKSQIDSDDEVFSSDDKSKVLPESTFIQSLITDSDDELSDDSKVPVSNDEPANDLEGLYELFGGDLNDEFEIDDEVSILHDIDSNGDVDDITTVMTSTTTPAPPPLQTTTTQGVLVEDVFTTETELLESQYPNGKPLLIGYDPSFVNPINSVHLNVDLPQLKGNNHSFIENDEGNSVDGAIKHSSTHLPPVLRNNNKISENNSSSDTRTSTIDSDSEERFIKVETKLLALDQESELNIQDGDRDFLIKEMQKMMT